MKPIRIRMFTDNELKFISQLMAVHVKLCYVKQEVNFRGTDLSFFASVEASGPWKITRVLVPKPFTQKINAMYPEFNTKQLAEIQELLWDMRLSWQSIGDVMKTRHGIEWITSRYKFRSMLFRSGYDIRHAMVRKEE